MDADTHIDGEIRETGSIDEDGLLKRPWCPETRILEHQELVEFSIFKTLRSL